MTTSRILHANTSFDQVVRFKVSRAAYNALVESIADDGHVRLTYDGEMLEIMSPGPLHEIVSRIIAVLVDFVSLEWELDISDLGSTLFKPVGGQEFEPDGAWYLDMGMRVRSRKNIDLAVDPPPDILLETDITTNSADKLKIFAEMRVPEVWLYNLNGFTAKMLENDKYVPISTSRVIAGLPIAEISKRIENEADREKSNMFVFRREWQRWLHENKRLHENP